MPTIDTTSLASSLPELNVPVVAAASGPNVPADVICNEPITAVRLLASLPANLGQNLDASA